LGLNAHYLIRFQIVLVGIDEIGEIGVFGEIVIVVVILVIVVALVIEIVVVIVTVTISMKTIVVIIEIIVLPEIETQFVLLVGFLGKPEAWQSGIQEQQLVDKE
jgi:hypothetical protein